MSATGQPLIDQSGQIIANGGVVMPLLDGRTDSLAARQLKRLFPGRRVVGVHAREILLGGGNIHCITQQVPRGRGAGRQAPRAAVIKVS